MQHFNTRYTEFAEVVHFECNGAKQKRNVHDKKIEPLFLSLEPHGLKGLFMFGAFSLENTLLQNVTSLYFLQQTETSRLEEGELCQKQALSIGETKNSE